MEGIRKVLDFWFGEDAKAYWCEPDLGFDQSVRKEFAKLFARAAAGDLKAWEATADGCLALCILLDQMPRSMFRGHARAFATDDKALAIAEHALAQGYDRDLTPEQKQFLYMPFMHSENLPNQLRALALFESQGMTRNRRYAEQHLALIRRFGRFPDRNAILGRPDSEAEQRHLSEVGDSEGQEQPIPQRR